MTVNELVSEVIGNFEGEFFPDYSYLVAEYNRIIRQLFLILPAADKSVCKTPVEGKILCDLLPEQIRRVFCGDFELMSASFSLLSLMPEAKLYHAANDGIYVSTEGECTVHYRSLPEEVSDVQSLEAIIPIDQRYIPLIRAWLMRTVYVYVGDFDSANAYSAEYNRYLEEYKKENGVAA